jgi:hypothetical protein
MAKRPLTIFKMASGLLVAGTTGCLSTAANLPGQPVVLTPGASEELRAQLLQVAPPPVRLVRVEDLAGPPPAVTLVRAAGGEPTTVLPAPKPAPAEAAAPPAVPAPAAAPPPASPGEPPTTGWARCKKGLRECFLGFREEFLAPPLGHFVYEHGKTMVANGDAARMVLYAYDFEEGCDRLNVRGHDQLVKICAMMPQNFYPLVIERTPCQPGLAEARRLAVLNQLAQGPFPVPPERVVVGLPVATGLAGREAEIVHRSFLNQTRVDGLPLQPPLTSIGGTFLAPGQSIGTGLLQQPPQ